MPQSELKRRIRMNLPTRNIHTPSVIEYRDIRAEADDTIVYFLTAAGRLKRFSRHSACLKTKKSRNVNENTKDMNRREQIIEQIYIVECSQRYSKHVKCRLERFKRPAAVK